MSDSDPTDFYIDYDKVAGLGIVGRADGMMIDTDYENWAVVYACTQKPFNVKNEWIWIYSQNPTIEKEHEDAAKKALLKKVPDFDLERFTKVEQDCHDEDEEQEASEQPIAPKKSRATKKSRAPGETSDFLQDEEKKDIEKPEEEES